jgi:hypothetical protein
VIGASVAGYQPLLLAVIVAVPIWLMVTRDGAKLLLWVVAVICLDIFNAQQGVNVSAASIAGLLLAPYSARLLFAFRRSPATTWAAAHFAYLVVLGLAFGLTFPWLDTIGRPLNLQPQGRTILYLMRETAGLSIAVFIGQQVAKAGRPDRLLDAVLLLALATSAFAILEFVTGISYYLLFSQGVVAPTYWNLRVRGLNFEPRGLGLVGAHALVVSILYVASRRRVRVALMVLGMTAAAMFLSASTSGLLAAGAGCGAVWLSHQRVRRHLLRAAVPLVLTAGIVAALQWDRIAALQLLLDERVGAPVRYGAAAGWFEEIVFRMEIFDASAALFMAANPLYLFIGTGPGLVPIPATPFMPVTPYTMLYVEPGLNSPPTMGLLLELANGGVIALVLWFGFVVAAHQSLRAMSAQATRDDPGWVTARWSFVGAATIYCVAAGFLSSCWPLFMGLGLGASFIRQQSSTVPMRTQSI